MPHNTESHHGATATTSTSASTTESTPTDAHEESPALGARGDWWGDQPDDQDSTADDSTPEGGVPRSAPPEDIENASQAVRIRFAPTGYPCVDDTPARNPGIGGQWKPDTNDPNELVAFDLLRETATMLCETTLSGPPYCSDLEALCALHFEGEPVGDYDPLALHECNREVELTDPEVFAPVEGRPSRHRKRYNPDTGYLTGGETTAVRIKDRPHDALLRVVDDWLGGRRGSLRESEKEEIRDYCSRMKKNQHASGLSDLDILTKVVRRVRNDY